MEYDSGLKQNEILIHVTTWMKPEAHYTSEISQTKKGQILPDSTYIRYLEYSNSQRQKVEWWLPGAGGGEMGNYSLMGTEFQCGKIKNFWRRIVVMFAQQYECT